MTVLGPLLFLIYINDLHKSIRFSKVLHFADDTSLIHSNKSVKQLNRHINHDLTLLCHWLKANKISLNANKTELIIFKSKRKSITKHLNFHISRQRITPKKSVKYLGLILDEHLSFNEHLHSLIPKLTCAVGMLAKIRHYITNETLKSVYFSIFNSHLLYGLQVWSLGNNPLQNRIITTQNKALRIITFKKSRQHSNP